MDEAWFRITHNEQVEALKTIAADMENVRVAWRHLIAEGEAAEAQKMSRSLWMVHEIRGWHLAADQIFGEAVRLAGSRPPSVALQLLVATSEVAQSWFISLLGRPAEGVPLAEKGVRAIGELDLPDELAFAKIVMMMSLYLSGHQSRMRVIGDEVLQLTHDPWVMANVHNWLRYPLPIDDPRRKEHLQILQRLIGNSRQYWLLYWMYLSQVTGAMQRGDYPAAREKLDYMLTVVKKINMKRGLHHTLYNLGVVARALGDYPSAWDYLLQSIGVSEELGGHNDKVSALIDLAYTLGAEGRTEEALQMAATGYAHPLSKQITVWDLMPMHERALSLRQSLEGQISSEAAEAAWQRGLAAGFDGVIAGLLEAS